MDRGGVRHVDLSIVRHIYNLQHTHTVMGMSTPVLTSLTIQRVVMVTLVPLMLLTQPSNKMATLIMVLFKLMFSALLMSWTH